GWVGRAGDPHRVGSVPECTRPCPDAYGLHPHAPQVSGARCHELSLAEGEAPHTPCAVPLSTLLDYVDHKHASVDIPGQYARWPRYSRHYFIRPLRADRSALWSLSSTTTSCFPNCRTVPQAATTVGIASLPS